MEFPRVSPESVGVPSQAVLDLLDELYRYGIEMHSFMLLRHGKVFAQGHWKPYNPQTPHAMFSFTKSLTSTAIGFAVQILGGHEGLLCRLRHAVHPSEVSGPIRVQGLLALGDVPDDAAHGAGSLLGRFNEAARRHGRSPRPSL